MGKHTKIIWAVITPSFPEQNAAFNINQSTATIIRNELIEGMGGVFLENIKNKLLNIFLNLNICLLINFKKLNSNKHWKFSRWAAAALFFQYLVGGYI